MKKFLALLLILSMFLIFMAACEKTGDETIADDEDDIEEELVTDTTEEENEIDDDDGEVITLKNIASEDNMTLLEGFRRGVNMGNIFEAPNEGEWGSMMDFNFFKLIKEKGFDFVRLPVSWAGHLTADNKDIDPDFLVRIVDTVDHAVENGLGIIVNIHHYDGMNNDPELYSKEFYMIWARIAKTFKLYPENVIFEILNEPHEKLNTKTWNKYQTECINIIRKYNPDRKIVVTGGNWGGYSDLMDLVIPNDPNLILSFHFYDPFNFTHQGASWASNMEQHLGTTWNNTDAEKAYIENLFTKVKEISEAFKIPVLLGEFGAYEKADMDSRVLWTTFMRQTAEKYGYTWSYWEFCAGFGIYNPVEEVFYDGLVNALTAEPMPEDFGSAKGTLELNVERIGNFTGPLTADRKIKTLSADSWTGYSLTDTADRTQILGLETVADWAQVYIVLDQLTDTGEGFSSKTCELTFKNIDNSITDFCINLDNNGETETQLLWLSGASKLSANTKEVVQNEDGTTTFILDLSKGYSALKNKCDNGIRLKMFVESVPDHSNQYDREGSMEFIDCILK